jgi:8-oxo-dGTP pyrophosphatase MutT (NUDIX family)
MYCNNCGCKGHVFRSCTDPIISYGILIIRGIYEPLQLPVDPRTLSVLMVRRKDSMSYMEFIRGKYELYDIDYIKKQLSNMTIDEQKTILTEKFEVLWKKIWGTSRDKHCTEYEHASQKFDMVDRQKIIEENPSKFVEPEWGFPKGRRMRGETDLDCAIRECSEETNIPTDAYTVREDIVLTETFTGTNNVRYKHVYFLALLKNSKLINLREKFTPSQRREISDIGWKTLAECKQITRPHYAERKQMVTELEQIVSLASK